jgi:hypothetical protein
VLLPVGPSWVFSLCHLCVHLHLRRRHLFFLAASSPVVLGLVPGPGPGLGAEAEVGAGSVLQVPDFEALTLEL